MALNKHKAERFENLAHYLAAFVRFLKGVDKIENPEKVAWYSFNVIGTAIALGNYFHHKLTSVDCLRSEPEGISP